MRIELPYGDASLAADLPDRLSVLGTIDVREAAACADPHAEVSGAIAHPIGLSGDALANFSAGDSVVILVSDSFRQTRADQMLPPLLDALAARGIGDDRVAILFSTGVHRAPSPHEQRQILGTDIYSRLQARLFCHDADASGEHRLVGTTSRGTPVEINRRLLETDHVIATGAVVLHYFGGFGGGRKSIVPGVASARTIARNHALNLHPTEDRLDPAVRIGILDGNPVAEDMLEAARLVPIDFIANTVLTRGAQIARVFAGEMDAAHRAACAFARELYARPIAQRADLVIAASAHTRNFVQTHKALYNAYQAVRPEGRIVLAAPCPEGLGGERFSKWLDLGNPARVIAGLRERSEINGQTALSTLEKSPITRLVTEMPVLDVKRLGARKAATLQEAIDASLAELEIQGISQPSAYLMPAAAHSVPVPPA